MQNLTAEDLTYRLIEHIPDKHFKMIRYYGFLSNRRRGEMPPALPCYASMLKKLANVDPY